MYDGTGSTGLALMSMIALNAVETTTGSATALTNYITMQLQVSHFKHFQTQYEGEKAIKILPNGRGLWG